MTIPETTTDSQESTIQKSVSPSHKLLGSPKPDDGKHCPNLMLLEDQIKAGEEPETEEDGGETPWEQLEAELEMR